MKNYEKLRYFSIGFIEGFAGPARFISSSIKIPVIDDNQSNIGLDWKKVGETMIVAAKKTKEKNAI